MRTLPILVVLSITACGGVGAPGAGGKNGAPGPQGAVGPQGPAGPAGVDGKDGTNGTNGNPAAPVAMWVDATGKVLGPSGWYPDSAGRLWMLQWQTAVAVPFAPGGYEYFLDSTCSGPGYLAAQEPRIVLALFWHGSNVTIADNAALLYRTPVAYDDGVHGCQVGAFPTQWLAADSDLVVVTEAAPTVNATPPLHIEYR